jgi:hypothetical protein
MDEVWCEWTWTERFPSQKEVVKYFQHVDKRLDLSRDYTYVARILLGQSCHAEGSCTKGSTPSLNPLSVTPQAFGTLRPMAATPTNPNTSSIAPAFLRRTTSQPSRLSTNSRALVPTQRCGLRRALTARVNVLATSALVPREFR